MDRPPRLKGAGYLAFAFAGVGLFLWAVLHIPPWFGALMMNVAVIGHGALMLVALGGLWADGRRARAAGRPDQAPWAGLTFGDAFVISGYIGASLLAAGMTAANL